MCKHKAGYINGCEVNTSGLSNDDIYSCSRMALQFDIITKWQRVL